MHRPSFSLGPESTPGPCMVGRNMSLKSPVTPLGIDTGTVRLVAQCLNHYTTPGPKIQCNLHKIKQSMKMHHFTELLSHVHYINVLTQVSMWKNKPNNTTNATASLHYNIYRYRFILLKSKTNSCPTVQHL
jgi:hypothetical protein